MCTAPSPQLQIAEPKRSTTTCCLLPRRSCCRRSAPSLVLEPLASPLTVPIPCHRPRAVSLLRWSSRAPPRSCLEPLHPGALPRRGEEAKPTTLVAALTKEPSLDKELLYSVRLPATEYRSITGLTAPETSPGPCCSRDQGKALLPHLPPESRGERSHRSFGVLPCLIPFSLLAMKWRP